MKEKILEKIKDSGFFGTYTSEYKLEEHREKYGESFRSAIPNNGFVYCSCNNMEFRVSAIEEDFGCILFLYNYTQIKVKIEDIDVDSLEFYKY